MNAPVTHVLTLDGAAVGTAEIGVLDAVARELELRQGGPTELTRFVGRLFQVVMNDDSLELRVTEGLPAGQ